MKPYLNKLSRNNDHSFSIENATRYHALNDWHYHPELELVYIIEGSGTLLIGDKFEKISSGQLIMIGCNVPHMFKFDTYTYQFPLQLQGKTDVPLQLLTLHVDPEILGEKFMMLPENKRINELFKEAAKGLYIQQPLQKAAIDLLNKLTIAPDYERILLLIQLLTAIGTNPARNAITSGPDHQAYNDTDEKRLTRVYLYTLNNFARPIKLKEVAAIVYMVPNAFCRYFKSRTRKSYFTFLMEVRIKHACKLLKENDYSVVVVCYESGFSNLSNFNRYFKLITGVTPLQYRRSF